MNLGKLLPQANKNKSEETLNNILYVTMVRWGWSYEQFCNTPYPVINRLLKVQKKVDEEQEKANKKK